eukprot:359062-Chlamydomonas_euryale.AAC.26
MVPEPMNSRPRMPPLWPVKMWRMWPEAGSQIRMVLSSEPLASTKESGLKRRLSTGSAWPL